MYVTLKCYVRNASHTGFKGLLYGYFLQKHYRGFNGVLYIGICFFSPKHYKSYQRLEARRQGSDAVFGANTQSRACKKFPHNRWSVILWIYYHSVRVSYVKILRYTSIMRRFSKKNDTFSLLKLANLMPYMGLKLPLKV